MGIPSLTGQTSQLSLWTTPPPHGNESCSGFSRVETNKNYRVARWISKGAFQFPNSDSPFNCSTRHSSYCFVLTSHFSWAKKGAFLDGGTRTLNDTSISSIQKELIQKQNKEGRRGGRKMEGRNSVPSRIQKLSHQVGSNWI